VLGGCRHGSSPPRSVNVVLDRGNVKNSGRVK
jgi:hypothetical protein